MFEINERISRFAPTYDIQSVFNCYRGITTPYGMLLNYLFCAYFMVKSFLHLQDVIWSYLNDLKLLFVTKQA